MELADDLRFTLDRTLEIALGLEEVNNLLHPKSIGSNAKKRILSISKEMRALSHHMKYRDSSVPRDTKISSQSHESPKRKTEVISDSPTIKVKRNLQFSLNETNQRLKLSRAGKRTIGSMITNEALDPPILKQILKDSGKNRFMKTLKNSEVKPLPYVSLTTGKIENPIELPSYEEYLESQGADFIIKRGKDELLYRIEKATNQLSKLKSELSLRNFTRAKNEDRKRRGAVVRVAKLHGTQRTSLSVDMRHESDVIMNKTQDLRALMHKYYAATPNSSTVNTPRLHNHSSLDAESSLEESLRSFYTSKAVENQKLIWILNRLKNDRPMSLKQKVILIQEDKEGYKNQLHSIGKFNGFRGAVEYHKREIQLKNYQQAIIYLKILDDYKSSKHEPETPELYLLELWKQMIEGGYTIGTSEFDRLVTAFTAEELNSKKLKNLVEKFREHI